MSAADLDFASYQAICALLHEEAACIDERRWDDWLALFTEDAIVWLPSWNGEHDLTDDPTNDVSLFYIDGKAELSDRVWRFASGDSPASTPLPRTSHLVGNIEVRELSQGRARVHSRWHSQIYRFKSTWSYAGAYRHELVHEQGAWRIARKQVVLCNDLIDSALDIYHV